MRDCEHETPSVKPLIRCRSRLLNRHCRSLRSLLVPLICLVLVPLAACAAELEDATKALRAGDHATCIKITGKAVKDRLFGEEYYLLKAEAELATGESQAALDTLVNGLARYSWSVRMRLLGIEAARMSGDSQQARVWLTEISDQAGRAPWRYSDADNLVALGRTANMIGADARQVLEGFYDRALKLHPLHRDALLASGELALAKQDFSLAADTFQAAVKKYPDDADLQFGVVRSLDRSEPALAAHALTLCLKSNHRHTGALLYRAENAIDAEQYDDASIQLDKLIAINPTHPAAWAYRSIIAGLRNDQRHAIEYRAAALSTWKENPLVDHLIGKKLSQKYRFTEGAAHQQQALAFDEAFQPARIQLAQDFLRLGKEEEGWKLGEAAAKADAYDVHVFNLMQLRDALAKYKTLEDDNFIVRMEAREAAIYGEAVVMLLTQAKRDLCTKYGLELKDKITVEIFPEPSDFAVRTFGMPGVAGYLGVCFGKVITANSPASQKDQPSNWQAVLWHEFCHVVTLEKTHNRMPRWLSEGISVYEERQANPTWGQRMNAKSRGRILSGLMTPIRELSGAFLRPESSADLNFAYFQSSLVVEFFIERYGIDALKKVLDDLATGLPIDPALERHLAPLDQLDQEFRDHAAQMARDLAPNLDWEKYDLSALKDDDDPDRLANWVADHPTSLQGLTLLASQMIEKGDYAKAKQHLFKLIELYPEQTGDDCPYELLAAIHKELKEVAAEQRVLEQYAARADAAVPSLLRLVELQSTPIDWPAARETVGQLLAINPLLPQTQRARAATAEQLGDNAEALASLHALLFLEPDDPAELHYRLAKLLHQQGDPLAKQHVLQALEAAPRYRDAQKLLLKIVRASKPEAQAEAKSP